MDQKSVPNQSGEPPIELAGPTPRRVRMTATAWINMVATTLFFSLGVALGGVIVKVVGADSLHQKALRRSGSETWGRVTGKWSRGAGTYISYAFAVDGTTYRGKSEVPVDIWNGIHDSDLLAIRFLRARPDVSHPSGWEDSTSSTWWLLSIPALLIIFSSLFVRRLPSQRRLARMGIPVRGSIAEREWKGPSKGQRYVTYTFRNADNHEVEMGSCPCDRYLRAGTDVWVLYLETNPGCSEIYPFEIDFFRIVS